MYWGIFYTLKDMDGLRCLNTRDGTIEAGCGLINQGAKIIRVEGGALHEKITVAHLQFYADQKKLMALAT